MYQILITTLAAGVISQLSKVLIRTNKIKFDWSCWRCLFSYSGMPSSHAAFVASLSAMVGLKEGLASPLFAVSFIFSILVIRDALGLRQYLGQHGQIINILVKDLKEDRMLDQAYPELIEKIGHTPAQIMAGSALGIIVSLISFYAF